MSAIDELRKMVWQAIGRHTTETPHGSYSTGVVSSVDTTAKRAVVTIAGASASTPNVPYLVGTGYTPAAGDEVYLIGPVTSLVIIGKRT